MNSRCAGRAVLLDDLGAGDVGRHQVGRELDAAEVQRQALGQGADHQRLGQAGHAFEDAVAPAEQGDQQLLDDLVLADDDAAELLLDVVEGVLELAGSASRSSLREVSAVRRAGSASAVNACSLMRVSSGG